MALAGERAPFWRRIRTFESLGDQQYRLLWLGQFSAAIGQWMDQVTRSWLIYELTDSPFDLGLVQAARGLPFLLFGLVAGVYADRSGRKQQLLIAQGTNALLNLALALLVVTGQVQPWHVYVTGFLAGAVQAFQAPARQTMISDMVEPARLQNALALNSAALQLARSLGPTIAGMLIASIGTQGSYFAQAALYLVGTLWTAQLFEPVRGTARRARQSVLRSLQEGGGFILHDRYVRGIMLLALGAFVLSWPYSSLMPVFARDVLHGDARLQGVLFTAVGIGALAGALLVASLPRSSGRAWLVCAGAAALGLAIMGFAVSSWLPVSLLLGVLIGLCGTFYQTQAQTMLQIITPVHLRGRVMGVYLLNVGLNPIGSSALGFFAAIAGAQEATFTMSGLSVLLALAVTALTPGLWRLRVGMGEASGRGGA